MKLFQGPVGDVCYCFKVRGVMCETVSGFYVLLFQGPVGDVCYCFRVLCVTVSGF